MPQSHPSILCSCAELPCPHRITLHGNTDVHEGMFAALANLAKEKKQKAENSTANTSQPDTPRVLPPQFYRLVNKPHKQAFSTASTGRVRGRPRHEAPTPDALRKRESYAATKKENDRLKLTACLNPIPASNPATWTNLECKQIKTFLRQVRPEEAKESKRDTLVKRVGENALSSVAGFAKDANGKRNNSAMLKPYISTLINGISSRSMAKLTGVSKSTVCAASKLSTDTLFNERKYAVDVKRVVTAEEVCVAIVKWFKDSTTQKSGKSGMRVL